MESAASGLVAGINAAMRALEKPRVLFPQKTVIGAMAGYISSGGVGNFQPMNANFGLVPPLGERIRGGKSVKNEALAARSLAVLREMSESINKSREA